MVNPEVPKRLEDLTEEEFEKLKEAGILRSIYPNAPPKYSPLRKPASPEPLLNPDFSGVTDLCKQYIQLVEDRTGDEDKSDLKQYIFEEAMTAVYGKDIFDKYINPRT